VEAALSAGRRTVERIWLERGTRDPARRGRVAHLIDLARRHGVPFEEVDRPRFERMTGSQPHAAHQGVAARVAALPYAEAEELLESLGPKCLLLVVDGVEDPRNLGALIRTAAAAGVGGVFIPERRAAGVSATVARASAGTVERVPVCRVGNAVTIIKELKERGVWTMALDAEAPRAWDETSYPARTALVVGGEGKGLRRLVQETCDEAVRLPLAEGVESLNVAVAAGICLYEALRQRRAGSAGGEGAGGKS
jgi:23S rRNA (guanosine2251-2'-O)-methyltransferase